MRDVGVKLIKVPLVAVKVATPAAAAAFIVIVFPTTFVVTLVPPKNVNSPLNDVTPFYDGKNKFFFSSNGKGGFGGFDVFEASVRKGKIK